MAYTRLLAAFCITIYTNIYSLCSAIHSILSTSLTHHLHIVTQYIGNKGERE